MPLQAYATADADNNIIQHRQFKLEGSQQLRWQKLSTILRQKQVKFQSLSCVWLARDFRLGVMTD